VRPETAGHATDPTMEQGLEVRALDEGMWRETATPSRRERKGERARFAVNAEAGNGRGGDARPRQPRFVSDAAAVGGGKASKGSRCTAGNPVSRQEETR